MISRRGTALFGSGNGHGLTTCSDGTQVVFQYAQVGHFNGYGIDVGRRPLAALLLD